MYKIVVVHEPTPARQLPFWHLPRTPVSKLVFIFVPVRELVWFPNSDWRVYLSFHSGSISAQTEILVWELGPSAQTGINESQFANWDSAHFGTNIYINGDYNCIYL